MHDVELALVARLEKITPQRGADHQRKLHAPIVVKRHRVDIRFDETADDVLLVSEHHIRERFQIFAFQIQIFQRIFESAQKGQDPEPRDAEPRNNILVFVFLQKSGKAPKARTVPAVGRSKIFQIRPVLEYGLFGLPHRVVEPLPQKAPFRTVGLVAVKTFRRFHAVRNDVRLFDILVEQIYGYAVDARARDRVFHQLFRVHFCPFIFCFSKLYQNFFPFASVLVKLFY